MPGGGFVVPGGTLWHALAMDTTQDSRWLTVLTWSETGSLAGAAEHSWQSGWTADTDRVLSALAQHFDELTTLAGHLGRDLSPVEPFPSVYRVRVLLRPGWSESVHAETIWAVSGEEAWTEGYAAFQRLRHLEQVLRQVYVHQPPRPLGEPLETALERVERSRDGVQLETAVELGITETEPPATGDWDPDQWPDQP